MNRKIVKFSSLEEEMEFWDTHDTSDLVAKEVTIEDMMDEYQRRSPKTRVTLRLETSLLNQIKVLAAKRGISYSALIRDFLWHAVTAEN